MKEFEKRVEDLGQPLVKGKISCMQMNMGYVCNLNCRHCHVEAGPHRTEKMSLEVIEDCLRFIENSGIKEIDITGGAPEMNPHLPHLITGLRNSKSVERIILRSNLTVLDEEGYADLPNFLAKKNVEIIASMPCYTEDNVTYQRGNEVYNKNIKMLKKLNSIGYGQPGDNNPKLHLVYNPVGNFLPGPQKELEVDYKAHLEKHFGIVFNSLYTMTNMPIGRFEDDLKKQNLYDGYMQLLADNFNAANLAKVMCLNLINVDWQGRAYDCDFSQVLKVPIDVADNYIGNITAEELLGKPISLDNHCYTCVAGAGSSCQGSLISKAG